MEVVAQRDSNYSDTTKSAGFECSNWRLRLTLKSNSNGKHMSNSSSRSWTDWRQHVRSPKLRPIASRVTASPSELTSPDTEAPSPSPSSNLVSSLSGSTRLYVGNLPYSAQRSHVSMVFLQAGFHLEDFKINMSTDPMTGRNPSYCFVEMGSLEEAERAIREVGGKEIMGRKVKVNSAAPPRRGSGASESSSLSHSSASSSSNGSLKLKTKSCRRPWAVEKVEENKPYRPTFDRWRRSDAPGHWQVPVSEGRRVFVGGLPRMEPQSAVDAAMQSLFSDFELEAVSKIISPIPPSWTSDRDRYYLFIDLRYKEDMEECVKQLNGINSPWGKGKLTVSKARDGKGRKVVREQSL